MKIEIVVEEDALYEARKLFKDKEEFIRLLNRFGKCYRENDRRYICPIMCTDKAWWRFKDRLTNTRTVFVEERYRNGVTLVVLHVLPRTGGTYDVIKWLWESGKEIVYH
jgi:hypothetical protein